MLLLFALYIYDVIWITTMNHNTATNSSHRNAYTISSFFLFISRNASKIFYLSIFILIMIGWKNKEFSNLTPETGLGYWLGIIGGCLMLILLLYPLRKKIRFMSLLGNIKYWFKMHMLFGVLGPVAILFHANFSLGSTNSNVAFFCMVIVASSGLVGRYLYAKIHHGLYGRKANLEELRESLKLSKGHLGSHFKLTELTVAKIKSAERLLLRNRNIIIATLLWPYVFIRTWFIKKSIRKTLYKGMLEHSSVKGWDKKRVKRLIRDANNEITPYLNGLYDMYGFRVFESLFSLWHFLHLPLFFMLVLTGIIHVVVVHSY